MCADPVCTECHLSPWPERRSTVQLLDAIDRTEVKDLLKSHPASLTQTAKTIEISRVSLVVTVGIMSNAPIRIEVNGRTAARTTPRPKLSPCSWRPPDHAQPTPHNPPPCPASGTFRRP